MRHSLNGRGRVAGPLFAGLLCATVLAAGTATAQAASTRRETVRAAPLPTLTVQGEDHAGFSRLVFPAPARGGYRVTADQGGLAITYAPAQITVIPATPPRNVAALSPGATRMLITAAPGGRITSRRQGGALIVDIADPVRAAAVPAVAAPASPVPVAAAAPGGTTTPADVPAEAAARIAAAAAVLAPAATPIQPVADSVQPAILFPVASETGAAAFRVGPDLVLVLDAPIAFDISRLEHDRVFGHLTAERTADAAVIHIPLAPPASLRLSRDRAGWTVTAVPDPDPVLGIAPRLVDDSSGSGWLQLPAAQPSRAVTIVDAATGSHVLVGTQGGVGQGVANARVMVQFSLLPTIQGVAVDARSDDIALRRETDGFSLRAGPHAGAIVASMDAVPAAVPGNTQLSRMFDFPDLPIATLAGRLAERIVAATDAPALGRALPRRRVAEAMVAMGLDVEAQGVLDVAVAANPELRDKPETIALAAIAAFVAGRTEAAQGLSDPRLNDPFMTGGAEIRLWRALVAARENETSPQAARDLAATVPLLLDYPSPLRERFLPMALQTMALGGQVAAAKAILDKRPDDQTLDLARGMMHEMAGEPDAALQAYGLVAGRGDRLPRYTAMVRAVAVRLARGDFGPREAADALDGALYAWRGDKEELALRIHMADLRRQTGQWRDAITLLREARTAFPDASSRVDSELAGMFTALLEGGAAERMAPAEFVALYDQNIDLLRQAPWSDLAGTALVNRLVALDLPGRADPVLTRMIALATDPARRAVLGARLASVRLSANDPAGAIAALATTRPPATAVADATSGTADAEQTRQLLYARAEAQRGNIDTAITMLAGLGSPEADDLRAGLLSARKDWTGAVAALSELERKRLPADAYTLSADQQAIVMRLASAATLAGDQATIDRLRTARGAAMAKGESAIPFQLITSPPVSKTTDLPRAFEEIQLARQLPARLGAAAQR